MKVYSSLQTTGYEAPGHPEAPWRVSRTFDRLKAGGLAPVAPTVNATEADVLSVHSPAHWASVKSGDTLDPDTPHFSGIGKIALISLSGCLSAYESALEGEPASSLMRPPGHHAAAERIAGFCYVNNMAVACVRALRRGRRVAVLEEAIERVLAFEPDVLGVSAGFDAYKDCPIAQMKLEKGTYIRIGKLIAETKLRRFAVLEGGYAPDLPILVENFLAGFSD